MVGPVFVAEWLSVARKPSTYAIRALVVLILLVALATIALSDRPNSNNSANGTAKYYSEMGQQFYVGILGTQLALVLLAAPAATASAVCMDKAQGNLTHLLTTDLRAWEIVGEKFLSRFLPVVGLVLLSLPVLFLATLLGGIDIDALPGAFLVLLASAFAGSSLAMLLSVVGRKTHEVLMATYLAEAAWLLLYPLGGSVWHTFYRTLPPNWFLLSNPFALLYLPYTPNMGGHDDPFAVFGIFALVAALFGAVCLLFSILLLRWAVLTNETRLARRKRPRGKPFWRGWRLFRGPSLDEHPLLWYERHVRRPSRWARVVTGIYFLGATGATLLALVGQLSGSGGHETGGLTVAFMVTVGMLMVSVSSVTALADERVRGSLDVLLTTPVSTRDVVWAKWRTAFRPVLVFGFLPVLLTFLLGVAALFDIGNRSAWMSSREIGLGFRLFSAVSVPTLIVAYGFGFASLGLYLATRVRRFAWAVALSVAVYAMATVGWVMLVMLIAKREEHGLGIAMASPFYGTGVNAVVLERGYNIGHDKFQIPVASVVWSSLYTLGAFILYRLTLRSFDRSFGRVPDTFAPPPRPRMWRQSVS